MKKTLKLIALLLILVFFSECNKKKNPVPGCMDSSACNYNSDATEDNGTCEYISCSGCMNQAACNYDSEATIDDGSCEFTSCAGCMDQAACNYDSEATIDDGSCEFTSCAGCMDQTACNYDSEATIDDGSCEFLTCAGCTDSAARNYDSEATIDDGSCNFNCTTSGEIGEIFVQRVPAENVDVRFEIEVNGVLVLRTINKGYTTVGNRVRFEPEDYDFNIEGSLNIIRFQETDGIMKIKLFIDDVLSEETDYSTCYIVGDQNVLGNQIPRPYYIGGPECGGTNCNYTAGISFNQVIIAN